MQKVVLRATASVVAILSAFSLTACSSSKPSTSTTSTSSSAPAISATPASSGSPSSTVSGAPADAQTTAAVKTAYETALNYKTPGAQVVALLQDGPAFASALQGLAAQAQTTKLTVSVSSVLLQSPHTAVAIFTLFTNGTAVAKDTPGYAVRENGTWKVAGLTFCGLVSQTGTTPPACMTPQATALPH